MFKNWRSTLIGIGMILSAAVTVAKDPTVLLTNPKGTIEEVAGGVAFILMREQKTADKEKTQAVITTLARENVALKEQ